MLLGEQPHEIGPNLPLSGQFWSYSYSSVQIYSIVYFVRLTDLVSYGDTPATGTSLLCNVKCVMSSHT